MNGFLSTYAALRLTGPPRKTLAGGALRGLLRLCILPMVAVAIGLELLGQRVAKQRATRAAEAKHAANLAAYAERQRRASSQSGHEEVLRRMMGEPE